MAVAVCLIGHPWPDGNVLGFHNRSSGCRRRFRRSHRLVEGHRRCNRRKQSICWIGGCYGNRRWLHVRRVVRIIQRDRLGEVTCVVKGANRQAFILAQHIGNPYAQRTVRERREQHSVDLNTANTGQSVLRLDVQAGSVNPCRDNRRFSVKEADFGYFFKGMTVGVSHSQCQHYVIRNRYADLAIRGKRVFHGQINPFAARVVFQLLNAQERGVKQRNDSRSFRRVRPAIRRCDCHLIGVFTLYRDFC